MKNSILAVAVIALLAFTSCKQNAADSVTQTNVTKAADRDSKASEFPVMSFDEKQFDFGAITQGTAVEHIFTYTNTGNSNLVIVNAKSSCGCTVPTFTKDPVAPGETGELLVKFNGSGKNQVSKTVTITANTQAGKETLLIKAFVNPKDGAPAVGLSK
tara:strand:- start:5073 stop:5546 length:474 start_codon:yes stop_codon:yes gene_type:complete